MSWWPSPENTMIYGWPRQSTMRIRRIWRIACRQHSCLPLGITGMLLAILAYPVYSLIAGKRKKRFAGQIMEISSGLM